MYKASMQHRCRGGGHDYGGGSIMEYMVTPHIPPAESWSTCNGPPSRLQRISFPLVGTIVAGWFFQFDGGPVHWSSLCQVFTSMVWVSMSPVRLVRHFHPGACTNRVPRRFHLNCFDQGPLRNMQSSKAVIYYVSPIWLIGETCCRNLGVMY
jgi:hypothetical protein